MIRYDDKVISVLSAWTLLSECTKKYTLRKTRNSMTVENTVDTL